MNKKLNKRGVAVTLGLLFAIAIVIVTVVAWRWLVGQRDRVWADEQAVERLPEVQARAVALQAEIAKRKFDVQRITAFLVSREELGSVVSEIEAAAKTFGVEVTVPEVAEVERVDENGKVILPSGPILDVRLKIVATGPPKQLLAFLHGVEHMQRLTYFESWRLDSSAETSRNQARTIRAGEEPAGEQPALLMADLIVGVHHD